MITTESDFHSIQEALSNFNILVDSRVSIAIENANSSLYTIKKLYKLNATLPFIIEEEGKWTRHFGYENYESTSILAVRRSNLNGVVISTCLVITHNSTLEHLVDKR